MMGPAQLAHTRTDPHTHHTLREDARMPSQTQWSKDERDLSPEEEFKVEMKKKGGCLHFSQHVLEKYQTVLHCAALLFFEEKINK